MKLTTPQIEDLFKFTRKHFVYHYDVQSELVDHLANDIEEIWKERPQLSFEDARDTSFKKFGIFGFMDVIEAKQKQMNKRYRSILWRFFREWFTLPKVMTTLAVFLSLFMVLKNSVFRVLPFRGFVSNCYSRFNQANQSKKNSEKENTKAREGFFYWKR